MSCVVEYQRRLVCVVIISLSLCVLAPKAVPVRGTARRPARPVSSVRKRAATVPQAWKRDGTGHAAPGNYRETITALDLSQVVVDAR